MPSFLTVFGFVGNLLIYVKDFFLVRKGGDK